MSAEAVNAFLTLETAAEHREEVKGSVFLAYGARSDSQDEAFEFLRAVLARHNDATHLCWAYKIGSAYRFGDGGEPGGTAGLPILRAIEGHGLDHVVVGVVRYFGGVKLGAGGLMRAYGGTAAEALRKAGKCEETPRAEIIVEVSFEYLGALYRFLDAAAAIRLAEDYTEAGLKLRASLPHSELDRLQSSLRDATRGQFTLLLD